MEVDHIFKCKSIETFRANDIIWLLQTSNWDMINFIFIDGEWTLYKIQFLHVFIAHMVTSMKNFDEHLHQMFHEDDYSICSW